MYNSPVLNNKKLLIAHHKSFVSNHSHTIFQSALRPLNKSQNFGGSIQHINSIIITNIKILSDYSQIGRPGQSSIIINLFFLQTSSIRNSQQPFTTIFGPILRKYIHLIITDKQVLTDITKQSLIYPIICTIYRYAF